jgi:hypothetical protein
VSIWHFEITPNGSNYPISKHWKAVGKHPSVALSSSFVTAVYFYVRLIPQDFGCLAPGHFSTASDVSVSPAGSWIHAKQVSFIYVIEAGCRFQLLK